MSQFPPESPYDPPLEPFGPEGGAPTQGNGMAVTSLVFGLSGVLRPLPRRPAGDHLRHHRRQQGEEPEGRGQGHGHRRPGPRRLDDRRLRVGTFAFVSLIKNVMTSVGETPNEFLTAISKEATSTRRSPRSTRPRSSARASNPPSMRRSLGGPFQKFTSTNMEQSNVNGVTTITLT